MTYYFQNWISEQKAYYSHRVTLGREWKGDYHSQIFRCLHPFQFLQSNDRVIQVGFHDGYIELGVSQPCIMAAIVGHVYAIDSDSQNCKALEKMKLDNVTVINQGVWSSCDTLKFLFFDDFSSSNLPVVTLEQIGSAIEQRWPTDRRGVVTWVSVDRLDFILSGKDVDFLNITVNGAEPEVIAGAAKLWINNPDMILAFPTYNVDRETYNRLEAMDYKIAVANAPHKPWLSETFYYSVVTKTEHDELIEMGFESRADTLLDELSYDEVGRYRYA